VTTGRATEPRNEPFYRRYRRPAMPSPQGGTGMVPADVAGG
jgi:hypothetical protein